MIRHHNPCGCKDPDCPCDWDLEPVTICDFCQVSSMVVEGIEKINGDDMCPDCAGEME
jgi:hypothetical protein